MHVVKFRNDEVEPRSDGRHDTGFIMNLTGVPLEDARKYELGYTTKFGYSGFRNFGAVVEYVDKIPGYSTEAEAQARGISNRYKQLARALDGKEFVIRDYLLMLPHKGDPRLGFYICSNFINQSGKVYINLLERSAPPSGKKIPDITLDKYVNKRAGGRSDGRLDSVYVLNLTGSKLADAKKDLMKFTAIHGYKEQTKFGAVFEVTLGMPNTRLFPEEIAEVYAKAFLQASKKVEKRRHTSRAFYLMLPGQGDPRFGFHLCKGFINEKGELFVQLLV